MSERIERFIHEILEDLEGKISKGQALQIAEEIRCHLDESIRARLEMGEEPETAETGALASFGNPRQVARAMKLSPSRSDERLYVLSIVSSVGVVLALCGAFFSAQIEPKTLSQIVVLVPIALSALAGWSSSRLNLAQLSKAFGLVLGASLLVASWLHIVFPDGSEASRREVAQWAREDARWEREQGLASPSGNPDIVVFERAASEARKAISSGSPPYKVPVEVYLPHGTAYKQAKSRAEALDILEAAEAKKHKDLLESVPLADQNAQWMRQQLDTPFLLNLVRLFPTLALITSALFSILTMARAMGAFAKRAFLSRRVNGGRNLA